MDRNDGLKFLLGVSLMAIGYLGIQNFGLANQVKRLEKELSKADPYLEALLDEEDEEIRQESRPSFGGWL